MSDISAGKQVRIARRGALEGDTAQTPGLIRDVAFDARNPDAAHLSAFLSTVKPGAVTGAHHHGDQETVLYVVSGTSRFRWGDRLEHVAEAGPGDFVFVPSYVVHQEINASTEFETVWAVVRSGVNPVVVNLPELDAYIEHAAIEYTAPQ
ncbi:cupin domain-containing protein [Microtetraspora malaysiensis]|uniref:cupin domain-containing protein n=1 Tax=Microtetraspora malaysiensis TaxID=161358 RepID=UPI0008346747|nr:cupin domain-containing protein [Microtetraspora malaysiensis]